MVMCEKTEFLLKLAKCGEFGTPDNPKRGSSGKAHFWNAFNGLEEPAKLKGTIGYFYASAGVEYHKHLAP